MTQQTPLLAAPERQTLLIPKRNTTQENLSRERPPLVSPVDGYAMLAGGVLPLQECGGGGGGGRAATRRRLCTCAGPFSRISPATARSGPSASSRPRGRGGRGFTRGVASAGA